MRCLYVKTPLHRPHRRFCTARGTAKLIESCRCLLHLHCAVAIFLQACKALRSASQHGIQVLAQQVLHKL
jgi:hypothetical protein